MQKNNKNQQNQKKEKKFPCESCNKLGFSCCKVYPWLSASELAKLYVKYEDRLKGKTTIHKETMGRYTAYIIVPSEAVKDGKIVLGDGYCVFYKDGKCSIYEDRPTICREYGYNEAIPCPFDGYSNEELSEMDLKEVEEIYKKNNKIRPSKKLFKLFSGLYSDKPKRNFVFSFEKFVKDLSRDDIAVLIGMNYVLEYVQKKNNLFDIEYEYFLIEYEGKEHPGFKYIFKSDKYPETAKRLTALSELITRIPDEAFNVLAQKANSVLMGTSTRCETKEEPEDYILFGLMLMNNYFLKKKENGIPRKKLYNGIMPPQAEVWEITKEVARRYGYNGGFTLPQQIVCLDSMSEKIINKINKLALK